MRRQKGVETGGGGGGSGKTGEGEDREEGGRRPERRGVIPCMFPLCAFPLHLYFCCFNQQDG